MTAAIESDIRALGCQRPEWEPWLAVVQEILRETSDSAWDSVIPDLAEVRQSKASLLAGAVIAIETTWLRRWTEQLVSTASHSGTEQMATLKRALRGQVDTLRLFEASLCLDESAVKQIALGCDADAEAFQAVTALLPIPFLHACNRRWAHSLPQGWVEGYCPICGAWPSYVEVRGIERSRYLRCGRCGAGWQTQCLSCPYCGMTDHNELESLVPEKNALNAVIDVCKRCLGYVKTFTKLQGSAPAKVILDDLASVELDIAAAEQGYKRPRGTGYALNVSMNPVL
jgi:FdhE protein